MFDSLLPLFAGGIVNNTLRPSIPKLKTSAYGGLLSISTLSITTLQVNPKIPEADTIRQWYNENGTESSSSTMVWETDKQSVRVTIEDLIEQPLPDFESPFCYFKAAIILIHNIDQPWYDACEVCNKKIYNTEQGIECSKCAKSNPEHHPSCVSLYDFSYIYNYLMASPRSLVDRWDLKLYLRNGQNSATPGKHFFFLYFFEISALYGLEMCDRDV
ncbi:hypothetical protein RHGRI_025636 [Rhododendron griersonianum]|uniref:Phorbol-ester/DAG-type domain-containing protein n=1 Tax=Rhododendron griersonianum TaxID=479676 RepID=A0AAV6IUM8_9ERIC|nr:hypothetical protein RHGRI_025636 [Rhododendron griersonianum]